MESFKVVTVGDGFCGKTSLLHSFCHNSAPSDYMPTVFDNFAKNIQSEGRAVQLQLWDTAGQESYARIRPLSYPLTDIFLVCFSVVQPSSFANVSTSWHPEITHHCPTVPFILVGTKTDLREDRKTLAELEKQGHVPVKFAEGVKMAKELGASAYVECSAMRQQKVSDVFDAVLRTLLHPKPAKAKKHICSIM